MAYYKCQDCSQSFVALSKDEAKELNEASETKDISKEEVQPPHAKFCPYCGSLDIEESR